MAVIDVTPQVDITALIDSDDVTEGDVLLLKEGIYFQTVNISKNYIRLIAKSPEVIFDGKGFLLSAFILSEVVGVTIEGMSIRHYRDDSIIIQSGSGNRIIGNRLNNVLSDAIVLISSSGNLIWKNKIWNCSDGIKLSSGSTNNWIIGNIVKDGFVDAFETSLPSDSNNAFISNIAINHRDRAFNIFGSNNLFLNNILIDHAEGIVIDEGMGSLAIGNIIKDNRLRGHIVFNVYSNYFGAENYVVCNDRVGMSNIGDFGIFLDNEVAYNGGTGFTLDVLSTANLVMDNKLICNIPQNIDDNGTNNNLINNISKSCRPCESPSDLCSKT